MLLRWSPYTLELHQPFTTATQSRTATPAMLLEVEHDGLVGYGEASMPPYLGESEASATAFFTAAARMLQGRRDPFLLEDLLREIDGLAPGNTAAKAAIDIALHDWIGRQLGAPWHRLWGLDPSRTPVTSFTLGIDTPEVVREKARAASEYKLLKVKLGRDSDRALISAIRDVTATPLIVDANQGWSDREAALREIEWLATQGVRLIEQPFAKDRLDDTAWLRARSPLPLFADESCQRLSDVTRLAGVFDGINVKLMKCTGLREARTMITVARVLGLKVMLGCMTETSCAISAAAQLSPLVDWADLDGALLIRNDPFEGARIIDGRVTLTALPGIGIVRR
jgi:L-alanine-DL-glutamate epimerase-like enolase superfamily enzyme